MSADKAYPIIIIGSREDAWKDCPLMFKMNGHDCVNSEGLKHIHKDLAWLDKELKKMSQRIDGQYKKYGLELPV